MSGRETQGQKLASAAWRQLTTETRRGPSGEKRNSSPPIVGSAKTAIGHGDIHALRDPCCFNPGEIAIDTGQNQIGAGQFGKTHVSDFAIMVLPSRVRKCRGQRKAQRLRLGAAAIRRPEKHGTREIGKLDSVRIDYRHRSRSEQSQVLNYLVTKCTGAYNNESHHCENVAGKQSVGRSGVLPQEVVSSSWGYTKWQRFHMIYRSLEAVSGSAIRVDTHSVAKLD